MWDTRNSPRLHFKLENGTLFVQQVSWYERPGLDDVHLEGHSHWRYGKWVPVKAIELEDPDGMAEIVLDKIIELIETEDEE